MASRPRYTDEHAKAGLDFAFPAIETWQNQFPGYEIQIDDPELTSVCPKTGLPDFGVLTIRYMPRDRCLELKSLKEYLFSYRNLGIFQENIVNQVLEDVVKACDPVWAVVKGEFRPRGGIGTTVEARWPRPAASGQSAREGQQGSVRPPALRWRRPVVISVGIPGFAAHRGIEFSCLACSSACVLAPALPWARCRCCSR